MEAHVDIRDRGALHGTSSCVAQKTRAALSWQTKLRVARYQTPWKSPWMRTTGRPAVSRDGEQHVGDLLRLRDHEVVARAVRSCSRLG